MKRIAAVVRPEKLEPLKEALFQAKISGMTIYQVHGCGNQHGWKEQRGLFEYDPEGQVRNHR